VLISSIRTAKYSKIQQNTTRQCSAVQCSAVQYVWEREKTSFRCADLSLNYVLLSVCFGEYNNGAKGSERENEGFFGPLRCCVLVLFVLTWFCFGLFGLFLSFPVCF